MPKVEIYRDKAGEYRWASRLPTIRSLPLVRATRPEPEPCEDLPPCSDPLASPRSLT